jgi:hypothetical protein
MKQINVFGTPLNQSSGLSKTISFKALDWGFAHFVSTSATLFFLWTKTCQHIEELLSL